MTSRAASSCVVDCLEDRNGFPVGGPVLIEVINLSCKLRIFRDKNFRKIANLSAKHFSPQRFGEFYRISLAR